MAFRLIAFAAVVLAGASLVVAEDKPLTRNELLSNARAANLRTRFAEAWPLYERLLKEHGDELELHAEVARGAANVLRLKRADEIIVKATQAIAALEDKAKARKIRKALLEVTREVKRIRDQQKNFVPKLVSDAISDLHKHRRAFPKSKMKLKDKGEHIASYKLRDEYSGPHVWGFAHVYVERGNLTYTLYERHRDADRAEQRFREIVSLCQKRKPDWEKRHKNPGGAKLRVQNREDGKGITYCWNLEDPILTSVASINLNAPRVKGTKEVNPDGIWTIVIQLDSGWFTGP